MLRSLADWDRRRSRIEDSSFAEGCKKEGVVDHFGGEELTAVVADKSHINGLVSPQQMLLVVHAHYIAIPVG
jgi:hypothetical protein